jgi:hypothetical protein
MPELLENDWLKNYDTEQIMNVVAAHTATLMKMPNISAFHQDYAASNFPDAYYVYCCKPFEAIAASWSRPNSQAVAHVKYGSLEYQKLVYDWWLAGSAVMERRVPHFYRIDHPMLLENAKALLDKLTAWLELPPHDYDCTIVGGINVKELTIKELSNTQPLSA